ncbi:histidine--tRNA ligase [Psychroflexus lacisalsi]|jgi:histidyl-tRNA synthetase|uniref:Histidine--tRNA ligase n=1 Tax=Psychroflexus lacisalsi TaxID=503928 RepID=A0ABN1KA27_9FLAO|nr:histidine--tRNA ligase [Psychroflexus lacisalsi]MBZ9619963.1 histidine--tRNA ligase [Psychroflexus lacisalsi]
MASKASIPKGTRDFSPLEVSKRQYIISTIQKHFKTFGFQPIETPTFENSDTLMGKYGEEGDRLIFKILNSGDYLKKANAEAYESKDSVKLSSSISEKALKYDLTVPFARYVVQHQNEIDFPFKRYQIQNVYRADRPQKGRFREFTQCDADVIGSDSLWQEVEFIQLYDTVFSSLKLEGVTIKMNNRKILSGLAEVIGESDKLIDFTVALDKLDKIGEEGVKKEMLEKGISESAIENIKPIFNFTGDFSKKINLLKSLLSNSEIGQKGIEELEFIQKALDQMPLQTARLDLDVTLARGLNYYTGAIFEISAPEEVKMGSIGGGGRYDDLTGIFGLKNMSGVGISFGLDRIYLVLEELNLFPQEIEETTKVLFINFGEEEALYTLKAISKLRTSSISSELYPDTAKMKKQMTYADRRNIPYVVLAGGSEMKEEVYNLKNMKTGEQNKFSLKELVAHFSN